MPLHCTCNPSTCCTPNPPPGCTCTEDIFFKNATCGFTVNSWEANDQILCEVCSNASASQTSVSGEPKPPQGILVNKSSSRIRGEFSESLTTLSSCQSKPKARTNMSEPKGCACCEPKPSQHSLSSKSRLCEKCSEGTAPPTAESGQCEPIPAACTCTKQSDTDFDADAVGKPCACCELQSSQRSDPAESSSRLCEKCSQGTSLPASPSCECKPKNPECCCTTKSELISNPSAEGKGCACCEPKPSHFPSKSPSNLCEKCSESTCRKRNEVNSNADCCGPTSSQRSLSTKSLSRLCAKCSEAALPTSPSCPCKPKPVECSCNINNKSNSNADAAGKCCACDPKPSRSLPADSSTRLCEKCSKALPISPSCQCKPKPAECTCAKKKELNTNADTAKKGCACCEPKPSQRTLSAKSPSRMCEKCSADAEPSCQCKPKTVDCCSKIKTISNAAATGKGCACCEPNPSERRLPSTSPSRVCEKCSGVADAPKCQCKPKPVASCCSNTAEPISNVHEEKGCACCEPKPSQRSLPTNTPSSRKHNKKCQCKTKAVESCCVLPTEPNTNNATADKSDACCAKPSQPRIPVSVPSKYHDKCVEPTVPPKSASFPCKPKAVESCCTIKTDLASNAATAEMSSVCCELKLSQRSLPAKPSQRICKLCKEGSVAPPKNKPREVPSCCINVTEPTPACEICGNTEINIKADGSPKCQICGNEEENTKKGNAPKCKICGNEDNNQENGPPKCKICGNEEENTQKGNAPKCNICGNVGDNTQKNGPPKCKICGNEEDKPPIEPAPKCDTCGKDNAKTCKTRNEKKDNSMIAQKFGQAVPPGDQGVGINITTCTSEVCPMNENSGCTCRFPPAFAQIRCTGQITGTCQCGRKQ